MESAQFYQGTADAMGVPLYFYPSGSVTNVRRVGAEPTVTIERRGDEFLAKWISAVAIFPCEGARDPESERALAAAFEKGGWERVTRLYRRGDVPGEQCWLKAPDWALAYV